MNENTIKMLPSIHVSNKRAYAQVKREALVSLKLTHSNIAAVRASVSETRTEPVVLGALADSEYDHVLEIAEFKPGDVKVIELPGGAKMEMVWCPPGSFTMGSPTSEKGRDKDEKQHRVTLTEGFWMGKFEVTQHQWESVMGKRKCLWWDVDNNPSWFKSPDCPVESVSWEDCQKFVAKVNATGKVRVSLPTEAQWEYACRAGTTTPYSFGSSLNGDKANCDGNYPYGTTVKGRCRGETVPVGSYAPNAWGLCDMHGNVWEWCSDWYGDYPAGSVSDPTGPASGASRVNRGGSWDNYARDCRSAYRNRDEPGDRISGLGFRLACSLP